MDPKVLSCKYLTDLCWNQVWRMEMLTGHFLEPEKWKGSLVFAVGWWRVAQGLEPQGDLGTVCGEHENESFKPFLGQCLKQMQPPSFSKIKLSRSKDKEGKDLMIIVTKSESSISKYFWSLIWKLCRFFCNLFIVTNDWQGIIPATTGDMSESLSAIFWIPMFSQCMVIVPATACLTSFILSIYCLLGEVGDRDTRPLCCIKTLCETKEGEGYFYFWVRWLFHIHELLGTCVQVIWLGLLVCDMEDDGCWLLSLWSFL